MGRFGFRSEEERARAEVMSKCDIDGVLIIPKDIAPEVIEKALVKASTEKTMRKAIEDGMMVTDAFAKFGVL